MKVTAPWNGPEYPMLEEISKEPLELLSLGFGQFRPLLSWLLLAYLLVFHTFVTTSLAGSESYQEQSSLNPPLLSLMCNEGA